jgi:RNA recognition motif-containing protein
MTCDFEVSTDFVYPFFSHSFAVQRAEVTYDGEGRSKGFGTVRFATAAEAQRALQQMNMTQLHNRYGR